MAIPGTYGPGAADGQPPDPKLFANWRDFATALSRFYASQVKGQQGVQPAPVLLQHADTSTGDARASVDGLVMFDPVDERIKFAVGGAWRTLPALDLSETITANWNYTGWLGADKIRQVSGQSMAIAAGESDAVVEASIDLSANEVVWLVAEDGVRIASSSDNWATGAAGAHIAVLVDSAGDSEFPRDLTAQRYLASVGGRVYFTAVSSGNPDYIRWITGNGLYGYENGVEVFRIGGSQFDCSALASLTTTNAANMWSSSSGAIRRSTSVAEVKQDYERLDPVKVKEGEKAKAVDVVEVVKALNPLSFESKLKDDKKADGTPGRFTGFIVEEIAEVYPEAIVDDGQNYDTRALLALAVAAIGQLARRVEELEKQAKDTKV